MNPLEEIHAFLLAVMLAFVTFVKLAEEVTRTTLEVSNNYFAPAVGSPPNAGEGDQTSPETSEGTDIDNPGEAYKGSPGTPLNNPTSEGDLTSDDDEESSGSSSDATIVRRYTDEDIDSHTDGEGDLQETHGAGPPFVEEECIERILTEVENCQGPGDNQQEPFPSDRSEGSGDQRRLIVLDNGESQSQTEQVKSQELHAPSLPDDVGSGLENRETDMWEFNPERVRTYVDRVIQTAVDQVTNFLDSESVDRGSNHFVNGSIHRIQQESEITYSHTLSLETYFDDCPVVNTPVMGGDASKTVGADGFTPADIDDIDLLETRGPSGDRVLVVDHRRGDQVDIGHSDTSEEVGKDSLASPPKRDQNDDDNAMMVDAAGGSTGAEEALITLGSYTPEESILVEHNTPQTDGPFDESEHPRSDDGSQELPELEYEGMPREHSRSDSDEEGGGDENLDRAENSREEPVSNKTDGSPSSLGSGGETEYSFSAPTIGDTEIEVRIKDIDSYTAEEIDQIDKRAIEISPGSADIVHTDMYSDDDDDDSKTFDDDPTRVEEVPIPVEYLAPEESVPVAKPPPQSGDRSDGGSHNASDCGSFENHEPPYEDTEQNRQDSDNEEPSRSDDETKTMRNEDTDDTPGSDLGPDRTDSHFESGSRISNETQERESMEVGEVSPEILTPDRSSPVESIPLQPHDNGGNRDRRDRSSVLAEDTERDRGVDLERRDVDGDGDKQLEHGGTVNHFGQSPNTNPLSSASDTYDVDETFKIQVQTDDRVGDICEDIDAKAFEGNNEPCGDVSGAGPDASYVVYLENPRDDAAAVCDSLRGRESDPAGYNGTLDDSYLDDLEAVHGNSSATLSDSSDTDDASLTSVSEDEQNSHENSNENNTQPEELEDGFVQLPDSDVGDSDEALDNSTHIEEPITFQEKSTDEKTPVISPSQVADQNCGGSGTSSPRKVYTDEDVRKAIQILTSQRPYYDTDTDAVHSDMSRAEAFRVFALVLSPAGRVNRERVFGLYNEQQLQGEINLTGDGKIEDSPEKMKAINELMGMLDTEDQPIIAVPESKQESRPDATSDYSQSDAEDGEDDESDSSSSASSGMYMVQGELDEEMDDVHVGRGGRGFFFVMTKTCEEKDGDVEHPPEEAPTSDIREEPDRRPFDEDVLVETETRILHLSEDKGEYDTYLVQPVAAPDRPDSETETRQRRGDSSDGSSSQEDVSSADAQEQIRHGQDHDHASSAASDDGGDEIIPTQVRSEPYSHPGILGDEPSGREDDESRLDMGFDTPTATEVTFEEVVRPASHTEDAVGETDFGSQIMDSDINDPIDFGALEDPESYTFVDHSIASSDLPRSSPSRVPTFEVEGGDTPEEGDFYLESGPREPLVDDSSDSEEPRHSSHIGELDNPTETKTQISSPPDEFVDWAKLEKAQLRLSFEIETPTTITFEEKVPRVNIFQSHIDENVVPTQVEPRVDVPINFDLLENTDSEGRSGGVVGQTERSGSPPHNLTLLIGDLEDGDYYLESVPRECVDDEGKDSTPDQSSGVESPLTVIETQTPDFCLPERLAADESTKPDAVSEDGRLDLALDIDSPTEIHFEESVLPPGSNHNVVNETVTPQILDLDKRREISFEFCDPSEPNLVKGPSTIATELPGKDITTRQTGNVDVSDELAAILEDPIAGRNLPVEEESATPAAPVVRPPEELHSAETALAPSPGLGARLLGLDSDLLIDGIDPEELPGGSKFIVVGLPTDDATDAFFEQDMVPSTSKEEETTPIEDAVAPRAEESLSSSPSSSSSSSSESDDGEEISYQQLNSDTADGNTKNHQRHDQDGSQSSDSDDKYRNSSGRVSSSSSSSTSSDDTAQDSSPRDLLDGRVDDRPGMGVPEYQVDGGSDSAPTESPAGTEHPVSLQAFLEKDPIDESPQYLTDQVRETDRGIIGAEIDDITADVECPVEPPIDAVSEETTQAELLEEPPTVCFTMYLGKSPIEDVPEEYEAYLEKGPRQPPEDDSPEEPAAPEQVSGSDSDQDDNAKSEEEYEAYLDEGPRQPPDVDSPDGRDVASPSSEESSDLGDKLENINCKESSASEEFEAFLESDPRQPPDVDSPDGRDVVGPSSEEISDLGDKLENINCEENSASEEFEAFLESDPRQPPDVDSPDDRRCPDQSPEGSSDLEDELADVNSEEYIVTEDYEAFLERSPRPPPEVDSRDKQESPERSSGESSNTDGELNDNKPGESDAVEELGAFLERGPRSNDADSTDDRRCPDQSSEGSSDLEDELANVNSEGYIVTEEYEAFLERSPRPPPEVSSRDEQESPERCSGGSSNNDDELDDIELEECDASEEFETFLEQSPRPNDEYLEKYEGNLEEQTKYSSDQETDPGGNSAEEDNGETLKNSPIFHLDDESPGQQEVLPGGSLKDGLDNADGPGEYAEHSEEDPRLPLNGNIPGMGGISGMSVEDYNNDHAYDEPAESTSSGPEAPLEPLRETVIPQRISTVESMFLGAPGRKDSVNDSDESDTTESDDLTPPRGRLQSSSASSCFSDSDTNHENRKSSIGRPSVLFALTGRPSCGDVPEESFDGEEPDPSPHHEEPGERHDGQAVEFEGGVEVYRDDVFHDKKSVTSYVAVGPEDVTPSVVYESEGRSNVLTYHQETEIVTVVQQTMTEVMTSYSPVSSQIV